MHVDQHGLELTAASEAAVGHYNRAVHELLHFREGCIDEARAAVAEDPAFPMGMTLRAYLRLLTSDAEDAAALRAWWPGYRAGAGANGTTPRERMHHASVDAWLAGDIKGAGSVLGELVHAYPRDALALSRRAPDRLLHRGCRLAPRPGRRCADLVERG